MSTARTSKRERQLPPIEESHGIWVPSEVITDNTLNASTRLVFSLIIELCQNKEHRCYVPNNYLAQRLGVSVRNCQHAIKELKEKHKIKTYKDASFNAFTLSDQRVRFIELVDGLDYEIPDNLSE